MAAGISIIGETSSVLGQESERSTWQLRGCNGTAVQAARACCLVEVVVTREACPQRLGSMEAALERLGPTRRGAGGQLQEQSREETLMMMVFPGKWAPHGGGGQGKLPQLALAKLRVHAGLVLRKVAARQVRRGPTATVAAGRQPHRVKHRGKVRGQAQMDQMCRIPGGSSRGSHSTGPRWQRGHLRAEELRSRGGAKSRAQSSLKAGVAAVPEATREMRCKASKPTSCRPCQ